MAEEIILDKFTRYSLKFIKKAKHWCLTLFEHGDKGKITQKQRWFKEKPILRVEDMV